MVTAPLLFSIVAFILVTGAECLHIKRVRATAPLAFGPSQKPSWFARLSPILRVLSLSALVWSAVVLLIIPATTHRAKIKDVPPKERQHLLLVLDVSPSMRLLDAGPTKKESRMARARQLMESMIARTAHDKLYTTVVAVYNGAKPVVVETRDLEVIYNLMNDLPMHQAFPTGKTKLIDGLTEASIIASKWPAKSATLLMISDGDTIPNTGMPKLPASISGVLIAGVGDPSQGTFIDGHHSRQDAATLQQIATRLSGEYHNGNTKLIPSEMLKRLGTLSTDHQSRLIGQRELALTLFALSTSCLALLPLLLQFFGSKWNPGPTIQSFQSQKNRSELYQSL